MVTLPFLQYNTSKVMVLSWTISIMVGLLFSSSFVYAAKYKLMHAAVQDSTTSISEKNANKPSVVIPQVANVYNYNQQANALTSVDHNPQVKPDNSRSYDIVSKYNASIHITSFIVNHITTNSAKIVFNTDAPTRSYIEYGLVGQKSIQAAVNSAPSTEHAITLTDIYPGVEYTVVASTLDDYGDVQDQRGLTFKTLKLMNEPNIAINEIQKNMASSISAFGSNGDNNSAEILLAVSDSIIRERTPEIKRIIGKDEYYEHRKSREMNAPYYVQGMPLHLTPATKAIDKVTLTKKFDIDTFGELFTQATQKQKKRMQNIEPALFAIDGLINGGVFKVLSDTKKSQLTQVVSDIDDTIVANDMINVENLLNAKLVNNSEAQWSAYAGSTIDLSFDDLYFIKPVKSLAIHQDGIVYKAEYMSDGAWAISLNVPRVIGLHDIDIYVVYEDDTFDLHKTKLKVSDLAQAIGVTTNAYTRLGSAQVSVYKAVYNENKKIISWQLYKDASFGVHNKVKKENNPTINPQITNQNGEFAMMLPPGTYKFAMNVLGYEKIANTIVNHPGGAFSASVLLSHVSETDSFIKQLQIIVIIFVIGILLYAIGNIFKKWMMNRSILKKSRASKNAHEKNEFKATLSTYQKNKRNRLRRKKRKIARNNQRKTAFATILLLIIIATSSPIVHAESRMIGYDGVLATSEDGRITNTNADVDMLFEIYDDELDGVLIDSFSSIVLVKDGSFHVDFPMKDLNSSKEYWVELKIEGDSLGRSLLKTGDILFKNKMNANQQASKKKNLTRRLIETTKKVVSPVREAPKKIQKNVRTQGISMDPFTSVTHYDRKNINLENLAAIASENTDTSGIVESLLKTLKDLYSMIIENTSIIEYNKKEIESLHNKDAEFDVRIGILEKKVL